MEYQGSSQSIILFHDRRCQCRFMRGPRSMILSFLLSDFHVPCQSFLIGILTTVRNLHGEYFFERCYKNITVCKNRKSHFCSYSSIVVTQSDVGTGKVLWLDLLVTSRSIIAVSFDQHLNLFIVFSLDFENYNRKNQVKYLIANLALLRVQFHNTRP